MGREESGFAKDLSFQSFFALLRMTSPCLPKGEAKLRKFSIEII
jgi:hypothetical protein